MALASGSQLGPYVILSRIGAGGMGEVYCARDPRLGRKVAIKILLADFAADQERLARFEQETKSLALLNHPNILHIYDSGIQDGVPFIVMELLEGENLRDRMDGQPLPIRKAVEIARQVATGLAAAHEKGIVHRDLKPENIFLTEDDRVKILDFGLAKLRVMDLDTSDVTQGMAAMASVTQAGMVVGTVGYLSPEQVTGKSADSRSDIFSLGVVLWEMLQGARPFRGASAVETMHAILKEDPKESTRMVGLPEDLLRILRRCMEKEPRARFQNARDLAFALESVAFTAMSQTAFPVVRRFWKPVLLWSAGLLGALGLLGGIYAMGNRSQHMVMPSFRRATYLRDRILEARFGPDGQTYVMALAKPGHRTELRSGRMDGIASQLLDFPQGTHVLSISCKGEMALLTNSEGSGSGLLSRAPMGGGSPRPIQEDVVSADWGPDGETLAVIRNSLTGTKRVEYPMGTLLFEVPSAYVVENIRVSPKGDLVAFSVIRSAGAGELHVVDLKGKGRVLVQGQCDSLVWSPGGDEILYTVVGEEDRREIRAVNLSGRSRPIHSILGNLSLCDMAPDGRVLVSHFLSRRSIQLITQGEDKDASWLHSSVIADLSLDGQTMIFAEVMDGRGLSGAYLRKVGEPGAVRLGLGDPLSMSPDGQWALVLRAGVENRLVLLPTGTGTERVLPAPGLDPKWGVFLRDNLRILMAAVDAQGQFHYYLQRMDTGAVEPLPWKVRPEAYVAMAPDGDRIAVGAIDGKLYLHSLSGKPSREYTGFAAGEEALQWSQDGKRLYTMERSVLPGRIHEVDLATGRKKLWRELGAVSAPGQLGIDSVSMTPDGKTYGYSYSQVLTSDLYLMTGWK